MNCPYCNHSMEVSHQSQSDGEFFFYNCAACSVVKREDGGVPYSLSNLFDEFFPEVKTNPIEHLREFLRDVLFVSLIYWDEEFLQKEKLRGLTKKYGLTLENQPEYSEYLQWLDDKFGRTGGTYIQTHFSEFWKDNQSSHFK